MVAFLIIAIIVLMIFNNSRQINARINIGIGFVKKLFQPGKKLIQKPIQYIHGNYVLI